MGVLVDSNILLDLINGDDTWLAWSRDQVMRLAGDEPLVINQMVYAEISPSFDSLSDLDTWLDRSFFIREELPWAAGFLAGQAFVEYRRRGGTRRSPLPDFYIGAHAQVTGLTLLTRDADRYQNYFPEVNLIYPEQN